MYASPAQLSDGTLIQPSTDGTIYALEPETGACSGRTTRWGRSAPRPPSTREDRIYVGTGEGRLVALEPDGTLRWTYRCIDEDRNDLNASPALGPDGIAIAGENGGVFLVPWDYRLSDGRADPRVTLGPGEALPPDGVFLLYTSAFGALRTEPQRRSPRTSRSPSRFCCARAATRRYAALDAESLRVQVGGAPPDT